MAHFVFVSLYDEFCHGMRMLVADLKTAGHRADLICYKQYVQVPMETAHEVWDECHVQVTPHGDQVNSYSYPATEREDELFIDLIRNLDPDMVGFGFSVTQERTCERLTRRVREDLGKPIIHGGPQVTASPRWSLDLGVDLVCIGEADDTLIELAQVIDEGRNPRGLRNLGYLDDQGEMILNPRRPLITDLDSLPFPDYSENNWYIDNDTVRQGSPFPESKLNRSYIVMTARGCPFHCSFCHLSIMNNMYKGQPTVRNRSVGHVIAELKQALVRHGGHFFTELMDSVFTLQPARMEEFLEAYHREINMPFWCYTHPACAKDETIKPLADCPNCEFVIMGIQSASEEIGKKTFHRTHDNATTLKAAETISRHGVRLFVDMITNVPGETDAMCRENLDLLRKLPKPWRLRLSKLSLFPEYSVREETGATKSVDSKRYELWNALYFLSQDVELSDETVDLLISEPLFEERPELVQAFAKSYDEMACRLHEVESRLNIEARSHAVTREALQQRERDLRDIRFRKGFRHFMRLSNMVQGSPANRHEPLDGTGNGNGHLPGEPTKAVSEAATPAGLIMPQAAAHTQQYGELRLMREYRPTKAE